MKFLPYLAFRLLASIPVLLILLTIIFFTIHVLPGNPAEELAGSGASQQYIDQITHELGLDKPIWVQYTDYMTGVFTGNLGTSIVYYNYVSVSSLIWTRATNTIQLAGLAWVFTLVVGLAAGTYSAMRQGKPLDHLIGASTLLLYAVPAFILGILMQLVFGVYLHWLPVSGVQSPIYATTVDSKTGFVLIDDLLAGNASAFFDALSHFLMPTVVLSANLLALVTKLTRSEVAKARTSAYCLLAEAKGMSERGIFFHHALRNALLPIITVVGLMAISLFTGAIVVETVFNINGLGSLVVYAASIREYNLLQGTLTIFAILALFFGIVIDIVYYFVDPRIRY